MNALKKLPPRRMRIEEFLSWADEQPGMWQLRDGEPEMMSPPGARHGAIQGEFVAVLRNHLLETSQNCRVVIAPGVIPRLRSDRNMLVPDIAVQCGPPSSARALDAPILLIEILSPSNETQTRANVWAFTTIPTVQEIVLVSGVEIGAEIFRRGADGTWPAQPEILGSGGVLRLESVGFAGPLRELYRTTDLIT